MSRVEKLWKERPASILDEYLHKRGLKRKPVAKDGCCLFRAVAEQAWLTQASHLDLRRLCSTHIKKRESKFTEFLTIPIKEYCWKLSNCLLWGGEMELVALSEVLNRVIHVYQQQNQQVTFKEFPSPKRNAEIPIMLAYVGNNHYDIVWRINQEQNAALCQSIIYDILVDKVLKNTMSTKDRERAHTLKKREMVSSPCDRQVTALMTSQSIDLLEALSCHIYVNTPLEVTKREKNNHEISDRQYAVSIQFSPGDECQVTLNNQTYFGEIQHCNKPSAKVFIYDLNKSLDVPFKDIMLVQHKKGSSNRMNMNYKQTKSTTGAVSNSSIMSEEGKLTSGKGFSGTRQSVSSRKPFSQQKTNKVQRAHPYYPNPQVKQKSEVKTHSQPVSYQQHETIEPRSSHIKVPSSVSPENPEVVSKSHPISDSPVTGNDLLKPLSGVVSPVSSSNIPNVPYSAIPESLNYTHQPRPYTIYPPVSSIGQQERYPPQYATGGGFSDITVRMNSLMGRGNPLDVLNQGNFTSITEAPESEWPILHAGGAGVDNRRQFTGQNAGRTFHLDGPPVNPPHIGVTNNGDLPHNSHLPPFMFAADPLQLLIQEMNPPVQLLKSGSIEGRQEFMFQFARNCLYLYSKYIADPELEDTLNDLLCMQFEDFISSPMAYTEGQLSVATSFTSREESEVTEDRVQTPSDQLQDEDGVHNYLNQDDDDRGSGTNINPSSTTQSHEATPTSPTESAPPFVKDESLPPEELETETRDDIPLSEETQFRHPSQDGVMMPAPPLPPHMMTHNPMMIPQYGYPGYPPMWMPPMLPWSYYPMHPFMFPHPPHPPPPPPPPPPPMMHGQYYPSVVTHEEKQEEEEEEEQSSENTEKPIVTAPILQSDNPFGSVEKPLPRSVDPIEPVKLVLTSEGSDRPNENSNDKNEILDSDTQTTPVIEYETTPKEQSFPPKQSRSQLPNPGKGRRAKTKHQYLGQRGMGNRNSTREDTLCDETTSEEIRSNEQNEEQGITPNVHNETKESFPRTGSGHEKTYVGQRTSTDTRESKIISRSDQDTTTSDMKRSGQDTTTGDMKRSGQDTTTSDMKRSGQDTTTGDTKRSGQDTTTGDMKRSGQDTITGDTRTSGQGVGGKSDQDKSVTSNRKSGQDQSTGGTRKSGQDQTTGRRSGQDQSTRRSGQDQATGSIRRSGLDQGTGSIRSQDQSGGTRGKRLDQTNRRSGYKAGDNRRSGQTTNNTRDSGQKNSGNRRRSYDRYYYQWDPYYYHNEPEDQQPPRQRNTKRNSTRETQQ